jgi:hypothetical protein
MRMRWNGQAVDAMHEKRGNGQDANGMAKVSIPFMRRGGMAKMPRNYLR